MTDIRGVHPYADRFPMLPEDELAELAESIRESGLRQPVVVTPDGLILDGRNRAAACDLLGIEPETVVYEGEDFAEYVIDCNTTRRHMSTGARAMASALVLADDGKRENGRFEYGSSDFANLQNSSFRSQMSRAGVVLDYCPEVAPAVINGDMALSRAFDQAESLRKSAEAEKYAARARAKAEREAEEKERETQERMLTALQQANATRYLALIDDQTMSVRAAHAAWLADTEKERKRRTELERAWRDTCTHIAESVRYLSTGQRGAEIFISDSFPHQDDYLAEGMRLTADRVDSAIAFLMRLRKEL